MKKVFLERNSIMRDIYENLEIETIIFETEDVITTSTGDIVIED